MTYQEYLTFDHTNIVCCENCRFCVKQRYKNTRDNGCWKEVCKNEEVIEADQRVRPFEVDPLFGYCEYFDQRNKINSCREIKVDSVLEIE